MTFDLATLEQTFAAVEQIGKGESTFSVSGMDMTLRTLLPEEEVEVQRYAALALNEEGEEQQHAAMAYLDRFKVGMISYSLVQIGDIDFRGQKYVETGETLSNGVPVKIFKHEAIQKLVKKWTRPVLVLVFRKYAELLSKVERQAESQIEFEPSDLDSEIQRLEERLSELKDARTQDSENINGVFSDKVKQIANLGSDEKATSDEDDTKNSPPIESEFTPYTPDVKEERRRIIPESGSPPVSPSSQNGPRNSSPNENQQPLPEIADSFVDSSDPDSMAAAIRYENERILEARKQSGLPSQNVPDSVLSAMKNSRREPPHRQAAVANRQEPMENYENVRTIEGSPVYNDPRGVEVIGTEAPRGKVSVNSPPRDGSRNPNFKPPNI